MKRKSHGLRSRIFKSDTAVSAVIGVILMVAITVIMAAIIMSWSSGVSAPEVPSQCGLSVSRDTGTAVVVTIYSIEPAGTSVTNLTYTNESTGNFTQINTVEGNPATDIGDSGTVLVSGFDERIVIKVLFDDGNEIVAFDGKI